jgi:hypothetical protein
LPKTSLYVYVVVAETGKDWLSVLDSAPINPTVAEDVGGALLK